MAKEEKKAYDAKYYQEHKAEKAKWREKYYQANKEKILEQCKSYRDANKEQRSEYAAKYYQEHKAEMAKRYQENKEKRIEYQTKYYKTPMGKAVHIAAAYNRNDKKANRGECTLTARWIVDSIFPMPCHYCGAIGWEIMGCDRIDNSLPHTPDNVVPCCEECNKKRGSMSYEEFINMFK